MPSKTPTRTDLVLALAQFDTDFGPVVANALGLHAERMRETAAECLAPLAAPAPEPQPEPEPASGRTGLTIDVTPYPSGLRRMAGAFTEAAERSDKALAAYKALAEQAETLAGNI